MTMHLPDTKIISLPVMEHFYTVQGEGAYSGYAAYFVRLGGCDVGCHWCDVKESWPVDNHPQISIGDIFSFIKNTPTNIVVITGGEPLMHPLGALTAKIRAAAVRTHIETSGAYVPTGEWDWFCLSPKKFKPPVVECYQQADELKIIVFNASDFDFAIAQASLVKQHNRKQNIRFFLQPEWGKRLEMMPLIVDFVKHHPEWQISLQTHKYLDIP